MKAMQGVQVVASRDLSTLQVRERELGRKGKERQGCSLDV